MRALPAALAVAVAALSFPATIATAKPKKPTSVGVGLREYRISLYRSSVPTGRVAFNSTNFGQDGHNIQVSGPKGYNSAESPEVEPFGGRKRFTVTLKRAGTYTVICTISDHAAFGMTAKLKVKAPKPKPKK